MEFVVHKRHSQPRLGEKGEFHDLGMELGPRSEMQIFSDSHHFVVWVLSDTGSLDSFKSVYLVLQEENSRGCRESKNQRRRQSELQV